MTSNLHQDGGADQSNHVSPMTTSHPSSFSQHSRITSITSRFTRQHPGTGDSGVVGGCGGAVTARALNQWLKITILGVMIGVFLPWHPGSHRARHPLLRDK
jgi:hypothetical protein